MLHKTRLYRRGMYRILVLVVLAGGQASLSGGMSLKILMGPALSDAALSKLVLGPFPFAQTNPSPNNTRSICGGLLECNIGSSQTIVLTCSLKVLLMFLGVILGVGDHQCCMAKQHKVLLPSILGLLLCTCTW